MTYFCFRMLIGCWIGVGLVLYVAGCTSASQRQDEAAQHATDIRRAPADFSMSFGKGGGYTGLWRGYTVAADGAVDTWQGRRAGDNLSAAGTLSQAQIDSLWHQVTTLDFFALENRGTGNMTGYIQIVANEETHEVRWPVSLEDSVALAPYEQLYTLARSLVGHAQRE